MSFVTVTELPFGAIKAGWGETRRRSLERVLAQLVAVQPDDDLMLTRAELRATCLDAGHALGQKVHEADRWIAATAMALGGELISGDAVFAERPRSRRAGPAAVMSGPAAPGSTCRVASVRRPHRPIGICIATSSVRRGGRR